jgi:hypothetical protein
MAKITITVEDLPNGKVKIEAKPNYLEIMAKDISGNHLTAADGYALAMLNRAREVSRQNGPTNLVKIPRIRYAH